MNLLNQLASDKTSIIATLSSEVIDDVFRTTGASFTDTISTFKVVVTIPPLPSDIV